MLWLLSTFPTDRRGYSDVSYNKIVRHDTDLSREHRATIRPGVQIATATQSDCWQGPRQEVEQGEIRPASHPHRGMSVRHTRRRETQHRTTHLRGRFRRSVRTEGGSRVSLRRRAQRVASRVQRRTSSRSRTFPTHRPRLTLRPKGPRRYCRGPFCLFASFLSSAIPHHLL